MGTPNDNLTCRKLCLGNDTDSEITSYTDKASIKSRISRCRQGGLLFAVRIVLVAASTGDWMMQIEAAFPLFDWGSHIGLMSSRRSFFSFLRTTGMGSLVCYQDSIQYSKDPSSSKQECVIIVKFSIKVTVSSNEFNIKGYWRKLVESFFWRGVPPL